MKQKKPNPGSDEAIAAGCTCPVMDNHHGAGVMHDGETVFWFDYDCFDYDCPLHGFAEEPQNE